MNEIDSEIAPARDWRARLAGAGPFGVIAFIFVSFVSILLSPIGSVFVLIWAWLARVPFSKIGFVRPGSWLGGVFYGVIFGVALKLFMKALVLPLLGFDAVNERFHFIQDNPEAALGLAALAVVAGFGEETYFRGYLFERIGAWLGENWFGAAVAIVLSSALFGVLHFQQGMLGIVNATIVGVITGAVYLANKRRLFMLMVAHASFDILSFAIIYFGLEQNIGSLIFHGA